MSTKKPTPKPTTSSKKAGFDAEERAAMKERARELKAEARGAASAAEGEREVLAKIEEMPAAERAMATKLHALVKAHAPGLVPKTWYGMPAYARDGKDGKIVCFFQSAQKFKSRYATLGFSDQARLDDGAMWPTAFALTKLDAAAEATIGRLLERAVG